MWLVLRGVFFCHWARRGSLRGVASWLAFCILDNKTIQKHLFFFLDLGCWCVCARARVCVYVCGWCFLYHVLGFVFRAPFFNCHDDGIVGSAFCFFLVILFGGFSLLYVCAGRWEGC